MAVDYSLPVRRAVLAAMKASPVITSLIPAGSIYPVTVPANRTFPFSRYGAPSATPFLASGLDSSSGDVALHGFTKPLMSGASVVETAEDRANKIAAGFVAALDGRILSLPGGMKLRLAWIGSNCLMDGDEPDAWHAVVRLRGEVTG